MDVFGDHAVACAAGGHRITRHNRVRNMLAQAAEEAGFAPQIELLGLLELPSRHPADCAHGLVRGKPARQDGRRDRSGMLRRPADVFIPVWRGGRPGCLDVALTAGIAWRRRAAVDAAPLDPLDDYEGFKAEFNSTRQECTDAGMTFTPCVLDADGGHGKQMLLVLKELATAASLRSGETKAAAMTRYRGRIGIAVAQANGLAIVLRGTPAPGPAAPPAQQPAAQAAPPGRQLAQRPASSPPLLHASPPRAPQPLQQPQQRRRHHRARRVTPRARLRLTRCRLRRQPQRRVGRLGWPTLSLLRARILRLIALKPRSRWLSKPSFFLPMFNSEYIKEYFLI